MRSARPALLAALIAAAACLPEAQAQSLQPYRPMLWMDPDMSSGVGADNLITVHATVNRLEDLVLPDRIFHPGMFTSPINGAYRFFKLILADLPVPDYLSTAEHEVFGHGARARELDYRDLEYHVSPPFPYSEGGGYTLLTPPPGDTVSWDEDLVIRIAGIEAQDVMARKVRARWLAAGATDYRFAYLYLAGSLGLENYVSASHADDTDYSNDILAYLWDINRKHGNYFAPSTYAWKLKHLGKRSYAMLADPFFWFSAWTALRYLGTGKGDWIYPSVRVGRTAWLPGAAYRLTPWGGEFVIENMFVRESRVLTLALALGDGPFEQTWGAEAEALGLPLPRGFSLDASLRVWRQPDLVLGNDAPTTKRRFGIGEGLTVLAPALSQDLPLRIALGLAHKTAGYVQGERLDAGFTVKAGLGWFP